MSEKHNLGADEQEAWQKRLNNLNAIVVQLPKATKAHRGLKEMPKAKREAYQEILDLIYECAPSPGAAKALISRIMARIA